MMKGVFISKSEFARLAFLSPGAITGHVNRGNLIVGPDGRIDLSIWDNWHFCADHRAAERAKQLENIFSNRQGWDIGFDE